MGKIKRIALVHDFLTVFAGAERVLKAFHELYPEAPIYTMFADSAVVAKHFPNATIVTSRLQRSMFRSRPWLLLPWMPQAVESFDLKDFDVVLSSSGAFSHGVITHPETTHICYCHSPMRYVWDWHAEYLDEKGIRSPFTLFFANQMLSKLRMWDAVSAKRVDRWIANSKTVAGRIEHYYRAKAEVIYPPVDTEFFDATKADASPLSEPYIITVSRLSKNKRVHHMVAAAAKTNTHLVIGGDGAERQSLEQYAQKLSAKVTFLGNISEETKRTYIAGSQAFLFAAEDDFGIAPVEALALGIPVIAFGKGGATESVQNGKNGYLYPEASSSSLAEALQMLLKDWVSMNPEKIRQSSLAFSTETFAKQIQEAVDHAE